MNIWNFKDVFLQPEQAMSLEAVNNEYFRASFNLITRQVVALESICDATTLSKINKGGNDNFFLTITKTNIWENFRLRNEQPDIYLVDTESGVRKRIIRHLYNGTQCNFSLGENMSFGMI